MIIGDNAVCLFFYFKKNQKLVSAEATFSYVIGKANKFKQAYRFYVFGQLHYWPIRATEVEVIIFTKP